MIPKKIHFIFGLSETWDSMPFSMYHYFAVLSAKIVNEGYEVNMHYHYEPTNNEWWERMKKIATLKKIETVPTEFHGKVIKHNAHKADWIRLQILKEHGGIYLDIDTICIRPFDPLLSSKQRAVMGTESFEGRMVTCNAVIMAEPEHGFIKKWMDGFVDFNPDDWNKIACRKPLQIAIEFPGFLHIESTESFFRLNWSWEDLKLMHEGVIDFPRSYCAHLWEHSSHGPYLSKLTLEDIITKDTSYNRLVRRLFIKPDAHLKSIV